MWEVVASILMKNRERIGSWRDRSVSDYHYYSSTVTFIGLDVIKLTLIFSFLFFSVCACMLVFSLTRCVVQSLRGSSIFTSASQDSDKVLLNPNRSESKPKCHLSFLSPLRDFSPIQPSRSYLGHCANKEHPVFKPGEALSRILLQGCGRLLGDTLPVWDERWGLEYITPSVINCCYL